MSVGRVFGALDILGPADRFELGLLLANPFELFPVVAADLAQRPIPTSVGPRRQFLDLVHRSVERAVNRDLSDRPLGDVVPMLGGLDSIVETSPEVTNRLSALIRGNGHRRWHELAECTVGEIRSWNGAGATLTARLVVAAVDAAIRATDAGEPRAPSGETATATAAAATTTTTTTTTTESATTTADAATTAAERGLITVLFDAVLAGFTNPKQRVAFELDDLRLENPHEDNSPRSRVTAEFVGVGYDHARQLRLHGRRQVSDSVAASEPLTAVVAELAERLGELANREALDAALAALGLPSTGDPTGLLALFAAGPYRPVPGHLGWWATRPAEIVAATNSLLRDGGGVHHLAALIEDLERCGVPSAVVEAWLANQLVRIEDGLVVHLAGRSTEIAARVLEATGRAMSCDELASWMPTVALASTLAAEIRGHRAFVQTGPDRWELAEWGGEPSIHLIRWRVPVTASAIVGDEADAPGELVASLALVPGKPGRLATRFGPISLAYDGERVVRGTARPIILGSGACVGDELIIVIDMTGQAVAVELDRGAAAPS